MPNSEKLKPAPRCRGAAWHIFTVGASCCSICGWDRYANPRDEKGEGK